jgi:hypothetical protein
MVRTPPLASPATATRAGEKERTGEGGGGIYRSAVLFGSGSNGSNEGGGTVGSADTPTHSSLGRGGSDEKREREEGSQLAINPHNPHNPKKKRRCGEEEG